jgi:CHAT domain
MKMSAADAASTGIASALPSHRLIQGVPPRSCWSRACRDQSDSSRRKAASTRRNRVAVGPLLCFSVSFRSLRNLRSRSSRRNEDVCRTGQALFPARSDDDRSAVATDLDGKAQTPAGMLVDGLRPAAALRAAQLEMSRDPRWQSPYFWAGFVLQGDWKQ